MPACWKPPKSWGASSNIVSHDECADAERAAELVGGDGHRGGAEFAEVERQFAGGLGGIGVERDVVLVADGGQFGDGLDDARFVVGEHRGDERVFRAGACAQFVNADYAVGVDAEVVDLAAALSEVVGERGDAGVFDGGDDEVGPGRLAPRATSRRGVVEQVREWRGCWLRCRRW